MLTRLAAGLGVSIDELVGIRQGPYYYDRGLFIFMR